MRNGRGEIDHSQANGNAGEPLLGRRVLRSVVNLLPERQAVVRARVGLERRAGDVVEHDIGDL